MLKFVSLPQQFQNMKRTLTTLTLALFTASVVTAGPGGESYGLSLSFNAIMHDSKVDLTWVTGMPSNATQFIVERSANGKEFEALKTISGSGFLQESIEYFDFDDQPLEGISYYRLKETDVEGNITYSEISTVINGTTDNRDFSNFYNAITGEKIDFELCGFDNEELLVVVRDSKGVEYYSKVYITQGKKGFYAVDLENRLPKGKYLVTGSSQDALYSQTIELK
jgi:hypothetical protein